MATINEKDVRSFPGLFDAGLISLPSVDAVTRQWSEPAEGGLDEVVYTCLATEVNPQTGNVEPKLVALMDNGSYESLDPADVSLSRKDLQPTLFFGADVQPELTFDRSLEDYGLKIGDTVRDPKLPNLGEWLVISDTEMICTDKDLFGSISILGKPETVLDNAKSQVYRVFRDELTHAEQEFAYNEIKETLQSNDEIYIDASEKESIINDLTAGKELAEAAERAGASASITENVMDTGIEFANEFESHASRLLELARGIGAKIKDFFVNEGVISTNEIMAKGASKEVAHAIHDTAELRQESRLSLRKFGEACREFAKSLGRNGIYALAGACKKMSSLRIDHYERLQAKEEEHIRHAMSRIKEIAVNEGNSLAAEQRRKAFIANIGNVIRNVGIEVSNAARFITSGNFTKAITSGNISFDPKPFHPMIEGKDIQVTRSIRKTSLYKHRDNAIINSALHLGQIKAKLFSERIAAAPRAEREQVADMLLGHAAESIGRSSMMDHKFEYSTLEGFPTHSVPHVMEFTRNGLVIDGQNMRDIKYEGISKLVSPNAMMHLFVEAERENIVSLYEKAELSMPDVVKDLDNENIRKSYNIGNRYDRNEQMVDNMSEIHKEMHEASNMLHGGYSFADKLVEQKEMKELKAAQKREQEMAKMQDQATPDAPNAVQIKISSVMPMFGDGQKDIYPALVIGNADEIGFEENEVIEVAGYAWTMVTDNTACCEVPINNDLVNANPQKLVEEWVAQKGIFIPEPEKGAAERHEYSIELFKKEISQTNPELYNAPESVIETAHTICHDYAIDPSELVYNGDTTGGVMDLSYGSSIVAAFYADTGECFRVYDDAIKEQLGEAIQPDDLSPSLEPAL